MRIHFSAALKKSLLAVTAAFSLCVFSWAEKYSADQQQGLEAFRKNDWNSAMFFFRKAGSSSKGFDQETLYMLVMSEMNAGEYKSALTDSNSFLQKFGTGLYAPYMQFQKGRALHFLGRNEDAVLVLSDFCHQNQDSELYAAALYWIAECFYSEYNFDSARALYERVVADFPSDPKVTDSRYRIEMIAQREREEKLIYLLKVTGEENLAAKEDYERQIKLYKTEDKMGLRKSLSEAEHNISELQKQLELQQAVNSELSAENAALRNGAGSNEQSSDKTGAESKPVRPLSVYIPKYPAIISDPEVDALKRKANHLQNLLDQQQEWEER